MSDPSTSYDQQIKDIFNQNWNPIGLEDLPQDEYDSYVGPIVSMIQSQDSSEEAVAQKLYEFETQHMGLTGDIAKCREIAEKIWVLQFTFLENVANILLDIENILTTASVIHRVLEPLTYMKHILETLLLTAEKPLLIDPQASFIELLGESLEDTGMLKITLVHRDERIDRFIADGSHQYMFIELVFADDVTISYPSGHVYLDYEEILDFWTHLLEKELAIKYVMFDHQIIGSGIWLESSHSFYMTDSSSMLSPLDRIKKNLGLLDTTEKILSVKWK
jgi:hypothetical protein